MHAVCFARDLIEIVTEPCEFANVGMILGAGMGKNPTPRTGGLLYIAPANS